MFIQWLIKTASDFIVILQQSKHFTNHVQTYSIAIIFQNILPQEK